MSKNNETATIKSIPEVEQFMDTVHKLNKLRAAHPEVFERLEKLTEEYNTRLEVASEVVKQRGVDCGPFTLLSEAVTYDGEKLCGLVGREAFEVVGTIDIKEVFQVDKKRLEKSLVDRNFPRDAVEACKKSILRYSRPKPIVLP